MSLYKKLEQVMSDRNVEAYIDLIHEDAEIIFHKSGNRFSKSEWASMVGGMMSNPKFVNDASRCVYENDDILVSHDFMSYPDDTKEAVMLVGMLKDGQIIRMETGATPLT
ncbi:nuclear transport factor 2 family protein [Planktomarina sp.]|nr:nuclear transport factor 2 family protein [Planktomarina sp.]